MDRHGTRRLRAALLALTATGGLLLTGCGAGGSGDNSSADRANGASAFLAPDHSRGSERDDESRDTAPDHLSTFALDVDTASYGYARRTPRPPPPPPPPRGPPLLRPRPPHPRRRTAPRPLDDPPRGVRQQLPPGLRASRRQRLHGDRRRRPHRREGLVPGPRGPGHQERARPAR